MCVFVCSGAFVRACTCVRVHAFVLVNSHWAKPGGEDDLNSNTRGFQATRGGLGAELERGMRGGGRWTDGERGTERGCGPRRPAGADRAH
jgi:hypothetical protein